MEVEKTETEKAVVFSERSRPFDIDVTNETPTSTADTVTSDGCRAILDAEDGDTGRQPIVVQEMEEDVYSKSGPATNEQATVESRAIDTEQTSCLLPQDESLTWTGWAEIENDPEIFTTLLHEWGARNLKVNEVIDIAELIDASPDQTLGLIFLSQYVSPEKSRSATPAKTAMPATYGSTSSPASGSTNAQPWFANQISKFSCGTVALMNILMNASRSDPSNTTLNLSQTLCTFKSQTEHQTPKERGMTLDRHTSIRAVHNAFSTLLDRMIVDLLVKEDAQRHKKRVAAEKRAAVAASGATGAKRKRGWKPFTKKRKRKNAGTSDDDNDNDDDDKPGFHFVAYVPSGGAVWKLDGMLAEPKKLDQIGEGQTWLNVAAGDLQERTQEAYNAGEDVSLMSVSRIPDGKTAMNLNGETAAEKTERKRKQEDWAPFIEHMLRLHAEKGDLATLLGLQ